MVEQEAKVRRMYFGKKRLARVKHLLKETDFIKLKYYGPVRLVNKKKILFYDVDFTDIEGNNWSIREFIHGEYKDKLQEIVTLLTKRVKIGTEINVD